MAIQQKLTPIAGAIAVALGLAAAPASGEPTRTAQSTSPSRAASPVSTQQATMVDMRASKLIGKNVRNAQGQDLGELSDLVVDLAGNRIEYAIVERGGVLGVGQKATAVPVKQFRSGARNGELVLNMSKEQLKGAPSMERTAEWSDPRTWDNIGQYYTQTLGMAAEDRPAASGERAAAGGRSTGTASGAASTSGTTSAAGRANLQRASDLIGMDVIDAKGDEVGEIEDLVVNLSTGSIHYAVLEFDRAWNPIDKLVALPLSSLQPKAGSNDLTINMTREQLANAPSFENSRWPDLTDSQFRDRVGSFSRSGATGMQGGASSSTPSTSGSSSGSSSQPATSSGSSGSSGSTQGSGTTGSQPR